MLLLLLLICTITLHFIQSNCEKNRGYYKLNHHHAVVVAVDMYNTSTLYTKRNDTDMMLIHVSVLIAAILPSPSSLW